MSFVDKLLGRTPTSDSIIAALDKAEASLAANATALQHYAALLTDPAGLTATEHATAEAEHDAARRDESRLTAEVSHLAAALKHARTNEAAADLTARRNTAQADVDVAYVKLLLKYAKLAPELAHALTQLQSIERNADAINNEIAARRKAGAQVPEPVVTPQQRYFSESDVREPDTTRTIERVVIDGPFGAEPVGVTQKIEDKLVLWAGQRVEKITEVVPGRIRPGRRIASPTYRAELPAARLGEKSFFPQEG